MIDGIISLLSLVSGPYRWQSDLSPEELAGYNKLWTMGLTKSLGFKKGMGTKMALNPTGMALAEELSGK